MKAVYRNVCTHGKSGRDLPWAPVGQYDTPDERFLHSSAGSPKIDTFWPDLKASPRSTPAAYHAVFAGITTPSKAVYAIFK